MSINDLFEQIQNRFNLDEIKGNFTIDGNCIIWSCDSGCIETEETEKIVFINDDGDEETYYGYTLDSMSIEEKLTDVYNEDIIKINDFFEMIEETDNWYFSEPDIYEDSITFKIF
jgi:hypothetical protein